MKQRSTAARHDVLFSAGPMTNAANGRKIIMAGAFPPPVRGMPIVNFAIFRRLQAAGVTPRIINLSAPNLKRSLATRLKRALKVGKGLFSLITMQRNREATFYISISSGFGQAYDIVFLCLSRLYGMRVFLHHHGITYIEQPNILSKSLVKIAGSKATHIAQCSLIAEKLRANYMTDNVLPLSNASIVFSKKFPVHKSRSKLRVIGFISNIEAEKGIFEFLDLMTRIKLENLPVKGILAGPFQDTKTERQVRGRLRNLQNIEYVGPTYGFDKESFFANIDSLIFPTHNDTEGIVNLEALSRGVPVIAYGRGCIPEIIGPQGGKVIDPKEPFVPQAIAQIKAWLSNSEAFEKASCAAAGKFLETYTKNETMLFELLIKLLGGAKIMGH